MGGGVPWRWSGALPCRRRGLPLPPWQPPCRAGVQFLRGDERRLRPAPREKNEANEVSAVLDRGLAAPWRGLGSGRRGRTSVEPQPPKGTPGSRAAVEGNRGRGRAGVPALRPAGPGLPGSPSLLRGAPGRGVGRLPPAGCTAGITEPLFVSPGAACKCVTCVHARSAPPAPSPGASFPGPPPRDLCPRGRRLGCRGSFAKLEGKGRGGAAPPPQTRGSAPKLVLQVQRPLLPRSSPASPGLGRWEAPKSLGRGCGVLRRQLGGCPTQMPPAP